VAADTRLTLQPSGHLLGSSLVHLHVGEGLHNLVYTADFKFSPTKLFEPAFKDFSRVETLLMESTYGAAEDVTPPRKEVEENFLELVTRVMKDGGKVLIPTFAVGRGQEIMAILASNGFNYPVYVDGMVWDATAIHTAYPEYLSNYLQKSIFHYGKNPFISEIFHSVAPKERSSIIDSADPCVILATSGMLMGGPAVEYLKGMATSKKNMLIFVGYQGIGTLGRKIQKGWREVPIKDETGRMKALPIEMQIETISGLSGHSDRRQLVSYISNLPRPERIIINHGEKKKSLELARDIRSNFRVETVVPRNLDVVRLV
jgi:predicted metal-dependent RNase